MRTQETNVTRWEAVRKCVCPDSADAEKAVRKRPTFGIIYQGMETGKNKHLLKADRMMKTVF